MSETMSASKELFCILIKEGQEIIEGVEMYDRPFDFEPKGRYVLVGVRQAGKSYMLYKRVDCCVNCERIRKICAGCLCNVLII